MPIVTSLRVWEQLPISERSAVSAAIVRILTEEVENDQFRENSADASRATAVVYIRQSDPKQVLKNRESGFNQRALRERVIELGWNKHQVILVDDDQGQSGKEASARGGFQALVADVSLRKVGIIMGYEVSRLSRNNADWQQLLQLCCLVRHADRRCRRNLQPA